MAEHATSSPRPSFVISTGDNFYSSGVKTDLDSQWRTTFREPYADSALQVPWFPVLGNHDYRSNPDAQIQYTKNARDDRWKMDGHYYMKKFKVSGENVSMDFEIAIVFLDTIFLAPFDSFFTPLDLPDQRFKEQMNWLRKVLKDIDNCSWVVVVGHYPIFSTGSHGDSTEMQRVLRPILLEHNIDAYVCGHDHSLQHLYDRNINYYVTGTGAKLDKLRSRDYSLAEELLFAQVKPGFTIFDVTKEKMIVQFIDASRNGTIYQFTQFSKRILGKNIRKLGPDDDLPFRVQLNAIQYFGLYTLVLLLSSTAIGFSIKYCRSIFKSNLSRSRVFLPEIIPEGFRDSVEIVDC